MRSSVALLRITQIDSLEGYTVDALVNQNQNNSELLINLPSVSVNSLFNRNFVIVNCLYDGDRISKSGEKDEYQR